MKKVVSRLEMNLEKAITVPLQNMSGCTCVLVYLNNSELTVANVGDTQY